MEIKLISLSITNFKGIKNLFLDFKGEDASLFGENATGKTTSFDAFAWLLFDKDSQNKKDFEIKTLVDGKTVSKLDHEVEAVLEVDGKQLTLRKVFKEKWTKKRGSITASFSGHTTDYFVYGVPAKKKEYEEEIANLVEEDVFRLLTNPSQFNEQLHWKDRRDLLLEIAGDITDEDVIASDKELAKLLEVLNGNSIEDHRKIIAAKRKDINKEIDLIPIRIDEIHRGLPDVSGLNESKIKSDINKISIDIEAKNEQINSIKNGAETNELKKQISDIELQIANVRNEHTQNEQQELYKLKARLQEEQSNLTIMRSELRALEQQKHSNNSLVNSYEEQMQQLREDYVNAQSEYEEQSKSEFNHTDECVCPTCDQELPEQQIEAAVTKFNLNKSKSLERIVQKQTDINVKGKELKAKSEEIKEDNESLQTKIDKITDQGKKKASDIEKLEQSIKEAESTVKPVEENEQYIKLNDDKKALELQIKRLEQSVEESINEVRAEISKLKSEDQAALQEDLSKFKQVNTANERIKQLEEQEKALAAEFEELEHQLHLTEVFTRKKVNMLTEKINSKFKRARFNLFKENINGGLEEICETTFEGVPYSSGLNDGHKILVGLDIIDTLSEHYGVQAPIFVDNAESVTNELEARAQIIRLVALKGEKKLRFETKSKKESGVA